MRRGWKAPLAASLVAAAAAWLYASAELEALTGARLHRLPDDPRDGDRPLLEQRVAGIELPRHGQEHLPWRRVRARFAGHLNLAVPGKRELRVVANGAARLRIDGREVLSRAATAAAPSEWVFIDLAAGGHALELDYEREDGPHILRLLVAEPGRAPARLAREQFFPDPPDPARLLRVERAGLVRGAARAVVLLSGLSLLALRLRTPARARDVARRTLRLLWRAAPLLVVGLAALLRTEALVNRQWQDQAPLALRRLAVVMWDLHPAGLRVAPGDQVYEGDPFTYLRFAREMQGFYDAHVREPVFVATTKRFLSLVGGADIGLSVTSAFYSTLLVGATYALGASFFSRQVGILAALALAVERQSIGFSVLGWRDDAFAFFTALTLVAVRRLVDRPGLLRGVSAGLVAAAACLTRITALAYVVPALAIGSVLAVRGSHGRSTRRPLIVCGIVFAAALAPYLLTCWIAFGDPLHAINAHTVFYRGRAGLPHDTPMNVVRFLGYQRGPVELFDTALVGLTAYPYLNKWTDFDDWIPGAAWTLRAASLLGLVAWLFVPRGRLLLVALLASLVPYAVTWEVPGGSEWRFTLHAYPFFLVAAFWTLTAVAHRDDRPRLLTALATAVLGLPVAWLASSGLHVLRVREDLHSGKPAFVRAGLRDAFLLASGWGPLRGFENGFARTAGPAPASMRLPLVDGRSYRLTLRLRAAAGCATPCTLEVAVDGRTPARLTVEADADSADPRFSSYEVRIETAQVKGGESRIELRGGPVDFWLAHVAEQPP